MNYSEQQAEIILRAAESCLRENTAPAFKLKKLWWTLLATRSQVLTNGLLPLTGMKVYDGPFKGMIVTEPALNQYRTTVLLGCYEQELHPTFEKIISTPYTRILNIGCSVGYYTVGLALRMPHITVEAFDTDPVAQKACMKMAQANHVQDRVRVSGEFHGEDFAKYSDEKTLVLMDIESGEVPLLDPMRYPALQKMDVIVELHDLMDPTISKTVSERFIPSHKVEIVKNHTTLPDISALLPETYYLDPFDQLLLSWEGHDGSTPWGIYIAK